MGAKSANDTDRSGTWVRVPPPPPDWFMKGDWNMININAYSETAERNLQKAIEQAAGADFPPAHGVVIVLSSVFSKRLYGNALKAIHDKHGAESAQVVLEQLKEWHKAKSGAQEVYDTVVATIQQEYYGAVADADIAFYSWIGAFDKEKGA